MMDVERARIALAPFLTPHEISVAIELCGKGDLAAVADRACLSVQAIKFHFTQIKRKLKISNRVEILLWIQSNQPELNISHITELMSKLNDIETKISNLEKYLSSPLPIPRVYNAI